jgi:hypothetical protein
MKENENSEDSVRFRALQFGRECRDGTYSVEWEQLFPRSDNHGIIEFNSEQRQIELVIPVREPQDDMSQLLRGMDGLQVLLGMMNPRPKQVVSLRYALIQDISLNRDPSVPSIYFTLSVPASFSVLHSNPLSKFLPHRTNSPSTKPISYLDEEHKVVAPFTSTSIRVIFTSVMDLNKFEKSSKKVHRRIKDYAPRIVQRHLYDKTMLQEIDRWLCHLPLQVAFQCDALLRNGLVDAQEMHSLRIPVNNMMRSPEVGVPKTATFLRHFANVIVGTGFDPEGVNDSPTALALFKSTLERFDFRTKQLDSSSEGVIDLFHATVTPTAIRLSGRSSISRFYTYN